VAWSDTETQAWRRVMRLFILRRKGDSLRAVARAVSAEEQAFPGFAAWACEGPGGEELQQAVEQLRSPAPSLSLF